LFDAVLLVFFLFLVRVLAFFLLLDEDGSVTALVDAVLMVFFLFLVRVLVFFLLLDEDDFVPPATLYRPVTEVKTTWLPFFVMPLAPGPGKEEQKILKASFSFGRCLPPRRAHPYTVDSNACLPLYELLLNSIEVDNYGRQTSQHDLQFIMLLRL
jgi:hypothetical protein